MRPAANPPLIQFPGWRPRIAESGNPLVRLFRPRSSVCVF